MKKKPTTPPEADPSTSSGQGLRRQAEAKLSQRKKKSAATPTATADIQRLIHELQVHQIELEMQNEELMRAWAQAEETYRQYIDLYEFAPVGYFTLARDGAIRNVNLAGVNLLGANRDELMKRRLGIFVCNEFRPAFNAFLEKLLSGKGEETCEIAFERKGNRPLWARVEATCFEGGQECRAMLTDITERKQAEELIYQYTHELEMRVEERTAELVRANNAKDDFLAIMSHELRTPLSSVLGFSEILLEGLQGPINKAQEQALKIIFSSGKHLLELIDDILDAARLKAGELEFRPKSVEVNEICQSSLIFIKLSAEKKSIFVDYTPSPVAVTVFADPKRLKQILINLLNNAIKFTPENGKIKLEVQADASRGLVSFSITDTGIGIKPEDQQQLFKPFVQLDSSSGRPYEGMGLGLSLVKKLVEMHGGSVKLQSEIGEGSCFTFVLPWHQ
jgi:PAS domain S-box-containing protein